MINWLGHGLMLFEEGVVHFWYEHFFHFLDTGQVNVSLLIDVIQKNLVLSKCDSSVVRYSRCSIINSFNPVSNFSLKIIITARFSLVLFLFLDLDCRAFLQTHITLAERNKILIFIYMSSWYYKIAYKRVYRRCSFFCSLSEIGCWSLWIVSGRSCPSCSC